MQRWFFLDEHRHKKDKVRRSSTKISKMESKEFIPELRECSFSVSAPNVGQFEKVCIVGNVMELGEWDYEKVLPMTKQESDNWTIIVSLQNSCNIFYRYCICILEDDSSNVMVCRWESGLHPRILKSGDGKVNDKFGEYGNMFGKVTSGFLTTQSLVQFKFMNNPLRLKSRFAGRILNIKVTPVKLSFNTESHVDDSALSNDTTDTEIGAGVTVEVSTLNNEVCQMQPQEQFGRMYKPDDIFLVNILAPNPDSFAYLVDFYSYSSRAYSEEPPCLVGYTYILPNMFKSSDGNIQLPVTCNIKHRPLGTVNIEYLLVHPMTQKVCDLRVSYAKHWDPSWTGLEVGHRGLGASFKTKEGNEIRENTIASLKKAAASGADLLEFDVQLSKDMIPVIYHDYYVCISMKRKKEVESSEMLELPVKDLSLLQLQKLKVYHLVEGRNHEILFFDDDLEEHQPFPTLEDALKIIDVNVGFNIELKWTMQLKDGTFELNNPFDMNTYVDKVLEVVLKHAGDRRIVMSCFNPDICTMVRHKQNKYPVMFLTIGVSNRYPAYLDARCLSIPAAVQNAVSSDILGIVVHTEDLLRDPSQVKLATDAGLVIFCWGDDNNNKNTIKKLKEMGLHAVIYDKLDQFSTKEVKESIFLVEARESQRELIRLAALDVPSSEATSGAISEDIARTRPFLDLSIRHNLQGQSTRTSLESLASDTDTRTEHAGRVLKRTKAMDSEKLAKERKNTIRALCASSGDLNFSNSHSKD